MKQNKNNQGKRIDIIPKKLYDWLSHMKLSNIKIQEIIQSIVDKFPVTKRWGPVWGKRILLGVVGIAVLFFILIISGSGSSAAGEDYAVVKQGDFIVDLVEAGDVEAFSKKLISAPMMWGAKLQVTDLIPEGTVVKQGDFLLQFDISDLEDTKKLREGGLLNKVGRGRYRCSAFGAAGLLMVTLSLKRLIETLEDLDGVERRQGR